MPVSRTSLEQDFQDYYNITKVHRTFDGGQKKVFIVTKDGKKVVLKLFHDFGKREIRELDIYEQYKNMAGIPRIILQDKYQNDKIIFEEYIEGDVLNDIIAKYKSNYSLIKNMIYDICDILEPIWNDSITHRDLKPLNIIIKPTGKPTVIDFGIARDSNLDSLTATGFMPKSWQFAAPEQFKGQKDLISYRSDFFSLAVVSYFLYYNKLPFGNSSDSVKIKYENDDFTFKTDNNCQLNTFLSTVFKSSPAARPRKVKTFKGLLK